MYVYIIPLLGFKTNWKYIILISKFHMLKSVQNSVLVFLLFSLCSPGRGGKELNQTPLFFVFRFIAMTLMETVEF